MRAKAKEILDRLWTLLADGMDDNVHDSPDTHPRSAADMVGAFLEQATAPDYGWKEYLNDDRPTHDMNGCAFPNADPDA